jgi:hypothetical protein
MTVTGPGAEQRRIDGFGRLDLGLRQASDWYLWGPLDTGIFDDDRYWVVDVTYAKADPTDVLMTIDVTNAGPDTEVLHVLPTLWFRNTWSWDGRGEQAFELVATSDATVSLEHPFLGPLEMVCGTDPLGASAMSAAIDHDTHRFAKTAALSGFGWHAVDLYTAEAGPMVV